MKMLAVALMGIIFFKCEGVKDDVKIAPPTQLDMIMNNEGDPVQRCIDMLGEPNVYPNVVVCEDIKYDGNSHRI